MGKKRRHSIDEAVEEQTTKIAKLSFDEIYAKVCDAEVVEVSTLEELHDYLTINKDSDHKKKVLATFVDDSFIASLLTNYGATKSDRDQKMFNILMLLERNYGISLRKMLPLVWGAEAREHYQKLKALGASLHTLSPDTIISKLDGGCMWRTVLFHSKSDPKTYDERFLLRLFSTLLRPGSDLSCKLFAKAKCLALAFSCTSSSDVSVRRLAYYVLQKYVSLLKELKETTFSERSLYVYVIKLFKQSIEAETPRISHLISHFFARVSKLILQPTSAAYAPILAFLCLKPQVDLNNVPEMYKLLFSSSVQHHMEEREWILNHICDGLIDPIDYNVLQNRDGFKLLLALFGSCMINFVSRRIILAIVKAAVKIPTAAHDLFHRCKLHGWIAATIMMKDFTPWEKTYLAEIFCILLQNERKISRVKGGSALVSKVSARIAAGPVRDFLKSDGLEEDSRREDHLQKIDEILEKKWKQKKVKAEPEVEAN